MASRQCGWHLLAALVLALPATVSAAPPAASLHESVLPSPVKRIADGQVAIRGTTGPENRRVAVRVTTSLGRSFSISVPCDAGRFLCRFPRDFPGAGGLRPMLLYVDATDSEPFGGDDLLDHQAEALLMLKASAAGAPPDLPDAFTDDLIDEAGNKDARCAQWPVHRTLVNLYLRSRGAKLARVGRPDFDLANAGDWNWFKQMATLYDFDHRDRDWSTPLGHRVAAGFWQAAWNRWFNSSNDHAWDGNPDNTSRDNYRPYTFANDHADILILHQMRRSCARGVSDHRDELCEQAVANLLAMQHRGADNFALPEASGKQEHYTAGAFRYGMFDTGQWLTEGTGWFNNPKHGDHRRGGVFNGRSVWALGESLKADPEGPHASDIRRALPLALRFCLHDGLAHGYTLRTKNGRSFWRDAGEHGYLALGMLAAAVAAPDLPISLDDGAPARPLSALCAEVLDALVDSARADGGWTAFPDQDAMAIAALADGLRLFPEHASARLWRTAATEAADAWMNLPADPRQRRDPTPHFGFRIRGRMSHCVGSDPRVRFTFYVSGHWLHALTKLFRATGDARYRQRCEALLAYLCGANPFHARLLNELGAVYNYVTDNDGDGIEDRLQYDMYPESTAFVQIGLLHFLLNE